MPASPSPLHDPRSRPPQEAKRASSASILGAGEDLQSKIVAFMVRWAAKRPGWRQQTLEVLVQSETEGIRLLEAALPAVNDTKLRGLVEKHLSDEKRHAMGFAARFEASQKANGLDPRPAAPPRAQHMSFTIMEFFAYLEVQEMRGGQILRVYRKLFEGDEETERFIEGVIRDEQYHATYTALQLERWAEDGLDAQVEQARRLAKRIDRSAFWSQVRGFLSSLPRLVLSGTLPPVGSHPSPSGPGKR